MGSPFCYRQIDVSLRARHRADMELKTKIVGRRHRSDDPISCYRRGVALMRQAEKLCPFPKPRGFIFKARTWEDYEAWKKAQTNPRLW